MQTAEDARQIAVKKIDHERQVNERQALSNAVAQSKTQADDATRLKEQAQSDAAMSKADAEQSRIAAQNAQQEEHKAIDDKAAIRAQLSGQLNKILATRDSARVNH